MGIAAMPGEANLYSDAVNQLCYLWKWNADDILRTP